MTKYYYTKTSELYHHGIKGQKWGVRRYQNPDGSLTKEGLKRYSQKNLKKANVYNLDKWGKDKTHNVLYVIGASGSGKSTTALGLANENDSVIHIDTLLEKNGQEYRNKDFEKFCSSKGINVDNARDDTLDRKERWKVIDAIGGQVEPYGQHCYNQGKRVIIEGVQMADDTIFPDKKYFQDRPIVTLHTSKFKSAWRAANRDKNNPIDIIKDFTDKERSEWYSRVERGLDTIDNTNKIQHSSLSNHSVVWISMIKPNSELYHHGIKGQKWGTRRYQNPDGSLTDEGYIRYYGKGRPLKSTKQFKKDYPSYDSKKDLDDGTAWMLPEDHPNYEKQVKQFIRLQKDINNKSINYDHKPVSQAMKDLPNDAPRSALLNTTLHDLGYEATREGRDYIMWLFY